MLAELKNISKYYEQPGTVNRNPVLDDISLTIRERDSIAITGPSGSGKSTLLNILGTLDSPSSGILMLDGTLTGSLDDKNLAGLRSRFIGFVFQVHHLLPQLTLIENVLLPLMTCRDSAIRKQREQRAFRLIERVGLTEHIHQYPGRMSVGECQRTAVARALVNQPALLLADEPTGSLDAENARELGQLLSDLNREENLALVVVTHSPELASQMGTIYQLNSGKLHLSSRP
jgi:ABC-type lipoprotein export system ATPase subunit